MTTETDYVVMTLCLTLEVFHFILPVGPDGWSQLGTAQGCYLVLILLSSVEIVKKEKKSNLR